MKTKSAQLNPEDLSSGLSAHELRFLLESLPTGGLQQIAGQLNLSYRRVKEILEGKRNNQRVIKKAMEMVRPYWKTRRKFMNSSHT